MTQSSSWVSIIGALLRPATAALIKYFNYNRVQNPVEEFCLFLRQWMHFWLSRGSILHKLSKILLSGKSTYGSRETELYSGARRMFWDSRMCLQTIYYIYATKGEITGMIARAMVILSIQVATVFAPERCDNLVWRASHYFQNMWSVSRLKDLVLKPFDFYTLFFVSRF